MKTIIVIAALFFSIPLHSQPTIEWIRTLDGSAHQSDHLSDMALDDNGNIYITASLYNTTTGNDIFTIKYNSSGQMIWSASYDTSSYSDFPERLILDHSGNIYVGGCSQNMTTYRLNTVIIKYNNNGNRLWVKNFYVSDLADFRMQLFDMDIDLQNNLYFTGYVEYGGPSCSSFINKLDTNGNFVWGNTFGPVNNASAFGQLIKVSLDGNVYVGGNLSITYGISSYLLLKYNVTGVLQWSRYTTGMDYWGVGAMLVDTNDDVYFTTQQNINWYGKLHLIKLNSAGGQVWDKIYLGDSLSDIYIYTMMFDKTGHIVMTGTEGSGLERDYLTFKYSTSGDSIWNRRYDGTGNGDDRPGSIDIDSLNNIYITGGSDAENHWNDALTIKYDQFGNTIWTARYNWPANSQDAGGVIRVSKDMRSIYLGGFTTVQGSYVDCFTLKYNQPIGIQQISSETPKSFSLSQNYPNPFNPSTKIRFEIPSGSNLKNQNVKLIVYDVIGKEVGLLVDQVLKPGSYEVEWDGSVYASGIYFYRIQNEKFTDTKKMILTK